MTKQETINALALFHCRIEFSKPQNLRYQTGIVFQVGGPAVGKVTLRKGRLLAIHWYGGINSHRYLQVAFNEYLSSGYFLTVDEFTTLWNQAELLYREEAAKLAAEEHETKDFDDKRQFKRYNKVKPQPPAHFFNALLRREIPFVYWPKTDK
jgi:hypothetical protein